MRLSGILARGQREMPSGFFFLSWYLWADLDSIEVRMKKVTESTLEPKFIRRKEIENSHRMGRRKIELDLFTMKQLEAMTALTARQIREFIRIGSMPRPIGQRKSARYNM